MISFVVKYFVVFVEAEVSFWVVVIMGIKILGEFLVVEKVGRVMKYFLVVIGVKSGDYRVKLV